MANQPPLSEQDRADLVAYLDGELEPQAARTLETKLQQNPQARAEAEALRRTWELLDYLPRPEPTPAFTTKTLERVSAYRPAVRGGRRWALAAAWAATVLLAGLAGFAGGRMIPHPTGPAPQAQDAGDRQPSGPPYAADTTFLKELAGTAEPELFGDELEQVLPGQRATPQARLDAVRERYTDWFARLPEADRLAVEQSPDAAAGLRAVKGIRRRQWVERLPRAEREQVQRAQGKEQADLVQKLHRQERQRRREWRVDTRAWANLNAQQIKSVATCPPALQTYVREFLYPLLRDGEKTRLLNAEGKWPQFLILLVNFSERHPVILLGKKGPTRFAELPSDVRQQVEHLKPEARRTLQAAEGRWPDYAVWVTVVARNNHVTLKQQLGACRHFDPRFDRPAQEFITRLWARLWPAEQKQLTEAEHHWPEYPLLLLQLANKHGVKLPPGGSVFRPPLLPDYAGPTAATAAR